MSLSKEIVFFERYLTEDEINGILDMFMLPFNNLDIVLDSVDNQVRTLGRFFLEDVKIYEGIYEEYKEHLRKKYEFSLIEAGTPIGAITSDAIGQQATQALLNTFHSVGTVKSGGPEGIKENIGVSPNRKIVYSIVHPRNGNLTYSEVMKLKTDFIGLSVSKLLLSPPKCEIIDIKEELKHNPFVESLTPIQRKKILKSKNSWWYSLSTFEGVYDKVQSSVTKRYCIRLRLDVQKLYEFKLMTSYIANFINKWKFQITIPKKVSKNPNKRETADEFVFAIPSPTNIGIIDIFMKSYDDSKDHMLISLIHSDEFKNLMVSGIDGISNFYAVSTSVTRLIRDIASTNRFDEAKGKKGTWLYLEDNRFSGIPYFRILNLLDKSGIKYEVPYFNKPNSYNDKFTELPFEFISHKSVHELRSSMKLRAYLFASMTEHKNPSFLVSNYSTTGMGSAGSNQLNKIECKIDHYTYEKIGSGFEVALYPFSQSNVCDGILATKKFNSKSALVSYISSIEQRMTLENFIKLFNNKEESYINFFREPNNFYKIINFEVNDEIGKYISYYMFQFKYIDYKIDVNLDYVNSRYITQSLDSTLFLQFGIPYDVANQGGVSLPESLRQYKIYDVVRIDEPEKRILLKTTMFSTDKYDHLNKPHRKIIISFHRLVEDFTKDNGGVIFKEEKQVILNKLAEEMNVILTEEEKKNILESEKLKPIDRFLKFIKERTNEADNNYVYGEASGSNFGELLVNPKVFGPKLICNHFYQVYEKFGLEGLRNTLAYDLINMINSSGYISVEYMNFLTNVTTHNGINPMTSEGISCQKRDFLAMITFDNAPKHTHTAALLGEEQNAISTSTCIFLGKLFKAGTGSVSICVDKSKLNVLTRKEGISEGFMKLTGIVNQVGGLVLTDENEEPIYIPKLTSGKFPRVDWVMDNFVEKDLLFYIQQGIDESKRALLMFCKPHQPKKHDPVDSLVIKFKRGNNVRP